MMQEDSNGESTFEFVDKKTSDDMIGQPKTSAADSLSSMSSSGSLVHVPSGGNLLSSVAPPSALPSFLSAHPVEMSLPVISSPPLPATSGPSTITPSHAFHPTTFSPVIPASSGGETTPVIPTAEEAVESSGDGTGTRLLGWMKGAVGTSGGILSKVAERAKSSVDSMITTLDPQMREFIRTKLVSDSGGDVDIIVASDKEVKVSPIREAFQNVFGKATVSGMSATVSTVAAQPVGFAAAIKAAEERIVAVRAASKVLEKHPVVAVENFLLQVAEDKWYDLGVLILSDPGRGITLQTFTQMTPVPASVVALAQEDTPGDYPLGSSGLAVTVGSLMASNLHVHHSEWHQAFTGVSRRETLLIAARTLAGIYKSSIAPNIL